LLLQHPEDQGVNCAGTGSPRRVSLSYVLEPDEILHTVGRVLSIQTP
jgi:hypothetical protein